MIWNVPEVASWNVPCLQASSRDSTIQTMTSPNQAVREPTGHLYPMSVCSCRNVRFQENVVSLNFDQLIFIYQIPCGGKFETWRICGENMKYYKESSNANEWRHISQGKAVDAPQ